MSVEWGDNLDKQSNGFLGFWVLFALSPALPIRTL